MTRKAPPPRRRVRRAVAGALRLPSRARLATERPVVIGAIGGSGTRILRRVLADAGGYMGLRITGDGDSVDLSAFLNRHLDAILAATGRLDYALDDVPPGVRREAEAAFVAAIRGYLADRAGAAPFWGWKIPRSLYVLPLIEAVFPRARYVQLVRDGRDMAFSGNSFQVDRHFAALMRASPDEPAIAAMTLWAKANAEADAWLSRLPEERRRVVRFEDLCTDPAGVIEGLLEWLGIEADARALAGAVRPPASLGRWRDRPPEVLARLEAIGVGTLARFGYLADESAIDPRERASRADPARARDPGQGAARPGAGARG